MKKLTTHSDKPKSGLSKFFDRNLYVILAFLCSAVIMLLVYYCFDIIPFGGRTVLRMDLYHQYGPLFAEFYDRLTQFKSFLYSWNSGGGGTFLGNYYNYLSSPIGDIIALIAGHSNIPEAIGTMVLVKNALASAALAYYLKKAHGKNDFTIVAFGIMYSFCGFFIAYYWNIMWIDAMYLLPLVVLGIEKIINDRKCKLYVGILALTFFSNYYMAYMICIFSILYFLVYYVSTSKLKETYPDIPIYEDDDGKLYSRTVHKITYNKFLRSGFLFAVGSLVAVMLVAFALIPTYYCLKTCSATSGSFPTGASYYNSIFDFLANHLASLEPTIRSSGNTVLPNVYCGILTIILVPLYIFCNKISVKERAAHILMLALFFVGFNLNYANYVLHAFHFPNDLPFRFSFLYSFLLIIMAYKVIVHIRDISGKSIIGAGVGVILFAIAVQKFGMDNVSDTTVYLSIGFVAVYTVVLGLMRKKEYAQSAVALLLMCCVFAEAAVADTDHFEITQVKTNFTNGYTDFRALKKNLDETEGTDKYRLELTNINTLMDASWFDYNGISVFSSMAYESSANLQNQLGLDSNYINSYIYYSQTPVYNAMMSLKYLVKNDNTNMNENLFSFAAQCGKFTAYKNNYYLPIAYTVNSDIINLNTSSSNPFEVQSDFWRLSTGLNGIFNALTVSDYELDNISESGTDFTDTSFSFFKENSDSEGTVTLHFEVPEEENVYLYLNSSAVDEITVYTDRGFAKKQSISEAYILDCGICKAGDILTVEIPAKGDTDSGFVECYAAGINMDVFEAGYSILSQGALNISEFEDTYLKGTVNAVSGKMLYTSINYDDGWTVKVDGVVTNKEKIGDALIGVYVPEGEHTIEFSYHPQGLMLGGTISAVTAVAVIIYLIIDFIRRKKKKQSIPVDTGVSGSDNSSPETFDSLSESGQYDEQDNSANQEKRASRLKKHNIEDTNPPTGIDAMMAEDLGKNATVEQAEALLDEPDEFEKQKVDTAPVINRADEILNTQKLDMNAILLEAKKAEEEKNQEGDK